MVFIQSRKTVRFFWPPAYGCTIQTKLFFHLERDFFGKFRRFFFNLQPRIFYGKKQHQPRKIKIYKETHSCTVSFNYSGGTFERSRFSDDFGALKQGPASVLFSSFLRPNNFAAAALQLAAPVLQQRTVSSQSHTKNETGNRKTLKDIQQLDEPSPRTLRMRGNQYYAGTLCLACVSYKVSRHCRPARTLLNMLATMTVYMNAKPWKIFGNPGNLRKPIASLQDTP